MQRYFAEDKVPETSDNKESCGSEEHGILKTGGEKKIKKFKKPKNFEQKESNKNSKKFKKRNAITEQNECIENNESFQADNVLEQNKSTNSGNHKKLGRSYQSTKFKKSGRYIKKGRKEFDYFDPDDDDPYQDNIKIPEEKIMKYQRGLNPHGWKKPIIFKADKKYKESVRQAARNEVFLTEEAGFIEAEENEDTFDLKQSDIVAAVDIASAAKHFSLSLPDFGPYKINYSRNGRHLLLAGRRGHIATMDWITKNLFCEINVMESVHDVCWLHVPTMFAAAQKEWVYVYDQKGTELHCIKKLDRVLNMEFLPYHFLLTTANERGFLSWLDVSVGQMIKETNTNSGRLNVMTQNPYNAVIATGHPNGCVKMWSPNINKPLLSMLCHAHPITSVAFDSKGLFMAVASVNRKLNIYDARSYKCLQSYQLGAAARFVDFSQRGLLSVGMGNIVEVYKNCCTETVNEPYLRHQTQSTITGMQFCPYEDVLGLGCNDGFESILIPGAGEPNFDSYESNPYQTLSQRRETEVKALLEKIQPEMIDLDPRRLGVTNMSTYEERMELLKSKPYLKPPEKFEPRNKARGRSKSANVFKRKMIVKGAAKREYIKSAVEEAQDNAAEKDKKTFTKYEHVLDRFKRKTK